MPFTVSPMFPGDLYDTMDHMGAAGTTTQANSAAGKASTHWRQILELGWQGVVVAEEAGGVGATLTEFAAIAEAAGRHAVAMPLIARCVVAPMLLARAHDNAAIHTLLQQMSAGQASVCPVVQSANAQTLVAVDAGAGQYLLQGDLRGADLSEPASHLVFNTTAGPDATPLLVVLPTDGLAARGVRCFEGLDGRRTADITLDGMVVGSGQVVLQGAVVTELLQSAIATGAVLTCVQTVGALGAMIEQTIDYLATRIQFGAALSTFQALRHRTVDMYVAYEGARGLVKQVTEELSASPASSPSSQRDAALTKLYLATVGRMIAESTIQLHGGMGMTVEMPAARLAMHTLMCNVQHGDRLSYLDSLSAQMAADVQAAAVSH